MFLGFLWYNFIKDTIYCKRKKTMKYFIYGLYSTEDEVIRYVGQTKSPLKQRRNEHKCDALTKKLRNHKCNWIRLVYRNGFEIGITLIEETDEKNWAEREIFWIEEYSKTNKLVNELRGGNCGGVGGKIQNYLPYDKAKEFVSKNMPNVKTYREYKIEYLNNREKYEGIIPLAPQKAYSFRKTWKGWSDFLETGIPTAKYKHDHFLSYDEVVKINKQNGIKSRNHYHKFILENGINAPYSPHKTYKDRWQGFKKFLGQE